MGGGSDSDREDRKERKARMKEEAEKLGISYDELKRRNKKTQARSGISR